MASETDTPDIMWAPTPEGVEGARLTQFLRWAEQRHGIELPNYRSAHAWSISDLPAFWDSVREFFGVVGDGFDDALTTGRVLTKSEMPGTIWYPDARLNFAENVLRHARANSMSERPAIVQIGEDDKITHITWTELESKVASLASHLRRLGVDSGDRVVASLPNIPETIICMLAAASIGAVWAVASPDLSAAATIDRVAQLEPTILIGCDGYVFNGRRHELADHMKALEAGLPSLRHVLLVRLLDPQAELADRLPLDSLLKDRTRPAYYRVAFDHPLWVLFSSGTTGRPKGIVHGHGGITLEGLKMEALQQDVGHDDRYYVAANTSWVVWNLQINNLLAGTTVVTYAGSPVFQRPDRQFQIIEKTGTTAFGTGAAYLQAVQRAGLQPGDDWDLSKLRSVLSTGSPLPASTWRWFHQAASASAHLGSDSGGTDVCSIFIGSNPLEPVYLGELQGPALGVDVQSWNEDGDRVFGEVGEMVITQPMPSMPVRFWGDDDGSLYSEAYFDTWPGVWRHGDWITETERGGFVIHGRSDATLNRQGIRLGTAEIYAAVDSISNIEASLVIGIEQPDGGYWMPLFVALHEGYELDDALREEIRTSIRTRCSARHVPDEVIQVPDIPVTHSMKRVEVPLKRLFSGVAPGHAVNLQSVANPEALDWFVDFARQRGIEQSRA